MKIWNVLPIDGEKVEENKKIYNMPYFTAALFAARGINPEEFECKKLSNPLKIKDMDKAVKRIKLALKKKEKICVYGDYDADGITSVSILYLYLKRKGANVDFFIPDRKIEGYGINTDAIKKFAKQGVGLIIAVDNGIACFDEVLFAKKLNIDVVIIDHHRQQGESVPEASAVVDPHRKDCESVFKQYCAAGLAFKLLTAMEPKEDLEFFEEYLNLAAIGTIGDAVPMVSENRKIVKLGIRNLQNTPNLGLKMLADTSKGCNQTLNFRNITFGMVPKINAAGRVSHGKKVAKFLTCEDEKEVRILNEEILDYNDLRKYIQDEILKQAMIVINQNPEILNNKIIIISGKNWNRGVIGIVASQICNKFGKPCIVISTERNEARGSGRSVEGFSLYQAICSCGESLTKYGGHHMAVGFSLEPEKIGEFIAKLDQYTSKLPQEITINKLDIDLCLGLEDLNNSVIGQLERLQPFGKTFSEPLIFLKNAVITDIIKLKNGQYVKFNIKQNNRQAEVVCFNYSYNSFPFRINNKIDLVVNISKNDYMGIASLSLVAEEIRLSGVNYENIFEQYKQFNLINVYNKEIKIDENILPTREDFALVYNFIRIHRCVPSNVLDIYHSLSGRVLYFKLEAIINILLKSDLIRPSNGFKNQVFCVTNSNKKTDIFKTELYLKLEKCAKLNSGEK